MSADLRLWRAGVDAEGEFHCVRCGYGVTVFRQLPTCPMCGGDSWEQSARRLAERARALV